MITVAHCLPNLPPACTFGSESELTYQPLALLRGPAPTAQLLPYREEDRLIERSRPVPTENDGSDVRRVLARCCFVNPVSDIAVLERPDDQDLPDESDIFDALVGSVPAFRVSVPQDGPTWFVSLDGEPVSCIIRHGGTWIWTQGAPTVGGMSGSPIISLTLSSRVRRLRRRGSQALRRRRTTPLHHRSVARLTSAGTEVHT